MLYIASDHGGFALKGKIEKFLMKKGIKFEDLGPEKLNANDDYPDYAQLVATNVARNSENNIGVLLCRSGQGMCIAANKIRGVRAASAWNLKLAASTRSEDMANVLCIASDHLSAALAEKITDIFIHTSFSKAARHGRRIRKITVLEKK